MRGTRPVHESGRGGSYGTYKTPTDPPTTRGHTHPTGPLAPQPRRGLTHCTRCRSHSTCDSVSVRSTRRHHPTNERPLSRRLGHVWSTVHVSSQASMQSTGGRLAVTRSADLHVCARAAATARAHAHMRAVPLPRVRAASSLGITQSQRPAVGTAWQARGSPGSMGSQGVYRNSRLAASEGWIRPVYAAATARHACAAATAHAAPRMCPPAPLAAAPHAEWWHQLHPAAATVAKSSR